jgi:hypothetical protein
MPRATLPRCLLKMQTIDVCITKTTEECIWTHLQNVMVGLEHKLDKYGKILNDLTNLYFHTNPYDKYTIKDWRDDRPRLKHKFDKTLWLTEVSEEYLRDYYRLLDVIRDIRICVLAFPEWEQRLSDTLNVIDCSKFDTTELISYESMQYAKSKKKYQEEDAEYIAERQLLRSHRDGHLTREKFLTDEFWRVIAYENKEPEYWKTCKWCIQHEKMLQDVKDSEKEEERRNQETMQKYEERMRQEQAERIANTHYYTCEMCDYRTTNIDSYESHLETKEHRVKQNHKDWFCESCNIQSRSKNEHEFHLKTTKHQQNAGLVSEVKEATKYVCECCEYETSRKDLYNRHLSSKKHTDLSSKK